MTPEEWQAWRDKRSQEIEGWARNTLAGLLSRAPSLPDPSDEDFEVMAGYIMGIRLAREREFIEAKDAELTSLKAENEALKEALEKTTTEEICRRCKGSGRSPIKDAPCNFCRGTGKAAREALSQSKTEVGG